MKTFFTVGKPIQTEDQRKICRRFMPVWRKTLTINNITGGIKTSRIFHWIIGHIIPEHIIAPSITSRREPANNSINISNDKEWDSEDELPISAKNLRI